MSRTISWEVIDTPDAKSLLQAAISDLATQQGCTACPPKTIPAFSPMLAPSQDPEVPAIEPLSLLCEAHPGCRVRIDESRNTTFLIEPPCLQESAPPHTTAAPLEKASSAPEVWLSHSSLASPGSEVLGPWVLGAAVKKRFLMPKMVLKSYCQLWDECHEPHDGRLVCTSHDLCGTHFFEKAWPQIFQKKHSSPDYTATCQQPHTATYTFSSWSP